MLCALSAPEVVPTHRSGHRGWLGTSLEGASVTQEAGGGTGGGCEKAFVQNPR